jgi:hypothetical protein
MSNHIILALMLKGFPPYRHENKGFLDLHQGISNYNTTNNNGGNISSSAQGLL